MSKKIPVTGVLAGLLLLLSMANVAFCIRYVRTLYAAQAIQLQARRLEAQTLLVNRNRAVFQSLAMEALEYGKKNPSMATLLQQFNPLLEQLNLRSKSATPAAPKPAADRNDRPVPHHPRPVIHDAHPLQLFPAKAH